MHKIPSACPSSFDTGNLKKKQSNLMSKNSFPDEQRYEIGLMRRNDGDAVAQHAEHFSKAFAR
jgi:hypothetical protein